MKKLLLLTLLLPACGDLPQGTISEPVDEPSIEEPQPSPTPYINPVCIEIMGLDGNRYPEGGFLMKNGDHTGKAVILFPSEYQAPFSVVRVLTKNGDWEEFEYTGKSNHTRMTYRGSRRMRHYINNRGNIRINAYDIDDIICIWRIKNADERRND